MTRSAARVFHKAAAHTALTLSIAAVALMAFTGIGFAAGWGAAPATSPASSQGQASASAQWLQHHQAQVQWMQQHPGQWQWMYDHMADITWMRNHWSNRTSGPSGNQCGGGSMMGPGQGYQP